MPRAKKTAKKAASLNATQTNANTPGAGTKTGGVQVSDGTVTVTKQPQSKLEAAKSAGMFLYTDDHWSQAYFNDKDLHCRERELFG